MPISPPAPERAQHLLAQLERYGSRENGQLAIGRLSFTLRDLLVTELGEDGGRLIIGHHPLPARC